MIEALRLIVWTLIVVIPAAAGAAVWVFVTLGAEIPADWHIAARVAAWVSVGGASVVVPMLVLIAAAPIFGVGIRTRVRQQRTPPPPIGSRKSAIVRNGVLTGNPPPTSRSPFRQEPAIAGD